MLEHKHHRWEDRRRGWGGRKHMADKVDTVGVAIVASQTRRQLNRSVELERHGRRNMGTSENSTQYTGWEWSHSPDPTPDTLHTSREAGIQVFPSRFLSHRKKTSCTAAPALVVCPHASSEIHRPRCSGARMKMNRWVTRPWSRGLL